MARRDRAQLRSAAPAADDDYDDGYDDRDAPDRGARGRTDRYADDDRYDDEYGEYDEYDDGYEEYDDYEDDPQPRRRTFDPDAVGPFDVEDLEAPVPAAGGDDNVDPKEYERLHNGADVDDDFRDDPAHAAWARTILTDLTDFGALRVPVPADGDVDLTVPPSGTMQAVHVLIPQGKLSVSALAAPRSEELWPTLASEIEASLRDGGATVRESSGEWGLELHAHTDVAGSVFVGVDGPRWMVYGVATGPQASAAELDAALRLMLRGMVVVRGRLPYPPRTVLPLELPEDLKLRQDAQVAAAEKAKAAGEVVAETPEPRDLPTTAIPVRPTPPRPPERRIGPPRPPQGVPGRRPAGHPGAGPRPIDPARRPAAAAGRPAAEGTGPNRVPFDGRAAAFRPPVDGRPGGMNGAPVNGRVNGGPVNGGSVNGGPANGVNASGHGPGVNGSGVNGSGVNGSGLNGSGVNGTGGVDGTGVNGSGVSGSGAPRGPVNGAVNGTGSHGVDGTAAYRPAVGAFGTNGSGVNGTGVNGTGVNGTAADRGGDARAFDGPPSNARPVDGRGRPDFSGFAPDGSPYAPGPDRPDSGRSAIPRPDDRRPEAPRRPLGDGGPVPRDARPAASADRPFAGDSGRFPARGSETGAYGADSGAYRREADSGSFRRDAEGGSFRRPVDPRPSDTRAHRGGPAADSGALAPRDHRPVRRPAGPPPAGIDPVRRDVPPAAELTGGHRAPAGTGGHRAPDPTGGYRAVPPTSGHRADDAGRDGIPTPPRSPYERAPSDGAPYDDAAHDSGSYRSRAYDNRGADPIAGRPVDGPPRTGRRAADDGRTAFRPPAGARPGGRRRAEDRDERGVDPQPGLSGPPAGARPATGGRRTGPEGGGRHGSAVGDFGNGAHGSQEPAAARADRVPRAGGGHRAPTDPGRPVPDRPVPDHRDADHGSRHGAPASAPHGGSPYEPTSYEPPRTAGVAYGSEYGSAGYDSPYSGPYRDERDGRYADRGDNGYGREPRDRDPLGGTYRNDTYGSDSYHSDSYSRDSRGSDSYGRNEEGRNEYGRDGYGRDSYGRDSYGRDPYAGGAYSGDAYAGDPYAGGDGHDQESSGRHGRPRRHSAEDMEGRPALAFLNGDPNRMFDGDAEPYPAGRHHRPR